ncbi:hypothetical protein HanRHA438_Chr01g0031301 [Helianthus annuus]|nr:hypothetical protein HanRHA438_Chr01g0031301 [Helianthus annuus]
MAGLAPIIGLRDIYRGAFTSLKTKAYCSSFDFRFFWYWFCVSLKDLLVHMLLCESGSHY